MKQRGFIATFWLYVIAGAAILAAVTGAYFYVDLNWETTAGIARGEEKKQAEWSAAAEAQRGREAEQADNAATKLETDNAKSRVVYKTLTQTVDRYIDRPVYRNVCLDADGLRDANAALRGGQGADPAKPDKPMPGLKPALRWDRGLGLAQADRSSGAVLRLPAQAPRPD